MRTSSLLIAAIAMACAGGAGLFLSGGDSGGDGLVAVVVARADIPRGSVLPAEALGLQKLPGGLVPKGVLKTIEEAAGRATLGQIVTGEMLFDAKLAPKGASGGIAALIPNGLRAIAIQIANAATGVAGFILPGSRVDVLISYNQLGGSATPARPEILLDNVEILAVDQRIEAAGESAVDAAQMRSVTLLVTPDQAARLHDAMHRGTLHLSLRNPTDTSRGSHARSGRAPWLDGLAKALAAAGKNAAANRPSLAAPAPLETMPATAPAPPVAKPPPPRLIRTVRGVQQSIVATTPRP